MIDLDQASAVGALLPPGDVMVLTPECAAPEYLRRWCGVPGGAAVASRAADVFCAGVMLARIFGSGERFYEGPEAALAALLPASGCLPREQLGCGGSATKRDLVLAMTSNVCVRVLATMPGVSAAVTGCGRAAAVVAALRRAAARITAAVALNQLAASRGMSAVVRDLRGLGESVDGARVEAARAHAAAAAATDMMIAVAGASGSDVMAVAAVL